MEIWFLLGVISYLSYAISTSIDKHIMNKNNDITNTSIIKTFFDGLILLVLGLIFFKLNFTTELLFWSLILGLISSIAWIVYYKLLSSSNISYGFPILQSTEIVLLFFGSIMLFSEPINLSNLSGVILIITGTYFVISTNIPKIRISNVIYLVLLLGMIDVAYWLIIKKTLFWANPIDLAILTYFSTLLILLIYVFIIRKKSNSLLDASKIKDVFIAAIFGSFGTFLLFSALNMGFASEIYPLAGLQSVFVLFLSSIFLKEKLYFHQLVGTILIFIGVFLLSI